MSAAPTILKPAEILAFSRIPSVPKRIPPPFLHGFLRTKIGGNARSRRFVKKAQWRFCGGFGEEKRRAATERGGRSRPCSLRSQACLILHRRRPAAIPRPRPTWRVPGLARKGVGEGK